MLHSAERILTTHAGSLPRPRALVDLLVAQSRGAAVDAGALAEAVEAATREVIAQQRACGIDVGNDGEQGRESFITYVRDRLSGFGGQEQRPIMRDLVAFPSFLQLKLPELQRDMVSLLRTPQAIGPVHHADGAPLAAELDRLLRLSAAAPTPFAERFVTAASPGIIVAAMRNAHYASEAEYRDAVATAMAPEYEAVAARGLVLQIDAPDLAMERHTSFADRPLRDFLAWVEANVAALNRALAHVPAAQVRLHLCWGNYEGPHTLDTPLDDLLPLLYQARVGALVLSLANPRHAHEHRCFTRHRLPDDWLLIAGVIDPTTNYVEHPEVVAQRLESAADAVGDPRRVLAGTDCGFDTAAGLGAVAHEVAWEKLRALRDGAALASQRLF
ncbi:MAG: methionine synthase [Deltaproteobacteria bacterium]|nr:methionine synthase [Deltaproteobacteria bacterium]